MGEDKKSEVNVTGEAKIQSHKVGPTSYSHRFS